MQDNIRSVMVQRMRLEQRIVALGGVVPPKWPWDDDGSLRNTQLIEVVEELEQKSADFMSKLKCQ
jgi:hypothetical protein